MLNVRQNRAEEGLGDPPPPPPTRHSGQLPPSKMPWDLRPWLPGSSTLPLVSLTTGLVFRGMSKMCQAVGVHKMRSSL